MVYFKLWGSVQLEREWLAGSPWERTILRTAAEAPFDMNDGPVLLSFADCSAKDANAYAESLAEAIKNAHPGVEVERRRDRSDAQDFGATLAIILGSASASAVAAGVSQWIARHSGARVIVRTADGTVVGGVDVDSKDAARIVEAALAKGR